MCYSLFAALFSKIFLSHPPFKYPGSTPVLLRSLNWQPSNSLHGETSLIQTGYNLLPCSMNEYA